MSLVERFILVFILVLVIGAKREAGEAHKHTHELACAVGADNLCAFHEEN